MKTIIFVCGRLPYKDTIDLPHVTTIHKELIKHFAHSHGRKPLPHLPTGEFSIVSTPHFQIAVFQYDTTATTGCSNTTSVQHKNLPPTAVPAPPSSVTLPSAAHVIPLLQVDSVIMFRMESMIDVLSENKASFDATPPPPPFSAAQWKAIAVDLLHKNLGISLSLDVGKWIQTDAMSLRVGGNLHFAQELGCLGCSDLCSRQWSHILKTRSWRPVWSGGIKVWGNWS